MGDDMTDEERQAIEEMTYKARLEMASIAIYAAMLSNPAISVQSDEDEATTLGAVGTVIQAPPAGIAVAMAKTLLEVVDEPPEVEYLSDLPKAQA